MNKTNMNNFENWMNSNSNGNKELFLAGYVSIMDLFDDLKSVVSAGLISGITANGLIQSYVSMFNDCLDYEEEEAILTAYSL